jgi:hypothetical protein
MIPERLRIDEVSKPLFELDLNTPREMIARSSGCKIRTTVRITGTDNLAVNILQLTSTVTVLDQWAQIMSVTTLNNLTNAYACLYD